MVEDHITVINGIVKQFFQREHANQTRRFGLNDSFGQDNPTQYHDRFPGQLYCKKNASEEGRISVTEVEIGHGGQRRALTGMD